MNILIIFLIIFAGVLPASGDIPSHINPATVNVSTSNIHAQQLELLNELLSYRSGMFISLNKGDVKDAMENLDSYLRILHENDNIFIGIDDEVYTELKKSGNTLNLTNDQINQLRPLYEEGKLAYQNNQTGKAIQIALIARNVIGNLSSLKQELNMEAVEQYPGVNITLYQNGLTAFNDTFKEIQKRWLTVELTLFDETETLISVSPPGGEFGDNIYIKGNLTLPRNGTGVPNASMEIKIDSDVYKIITDRNGKYNLTYKIPYKKDGVYPVMVNFIPVTEPLLDSSAKGTFFIKPTNTALSFNADPAYGKFGEIIKLSGGLTSRNSSRVADADIVITLDENTLVNVKTDQKGSFEYNFNLPAMAQGEHAVNAEFLPSQQPLIQSGNKTTIRLMPSNTMLEISGQNIAYQQDYLNLTGKLVTDRNLGIPAARVSVLLDKKEVGNAIVNRGDFFLSYWIEKNTSLGNHTVAVKFNGDSPFLPSENSISVEIKNKPLSSRYIILLAIAAGIIIIFYIKREKAFILLNALGSAVQARIGPGIKPETSPVTQEPLKDAQIKPQEPEVQLQEQDMFNKGYSHLDDLIGQKQFKESISFSYKYAKYFISIYSGIKSMPQQTHWEFYNLVKRSQPAFEDDFLELTELFETAMYSNRKIDAQLAEKAIDLLRKIDKQSNDKNK
ncbi:MAG: DUF4129 domain-containing protein [Candidatus Methanoperedens sp.]|nr:DUF4129 domain-containing protein [Candidatus Methanoperedens sp.]